MIDLRKYFDAAWVANLDICPKRMDQFHRRAKAANVKGYERYRAVEGDKCPHPAWWRAGNGAWGCMMTHLRACQDALMDGCENYIIFEDDACFSEDFAVRLPRIMDEVGKLNGEWDMLYLGGQHLYLESARPYPYREGLVKCYNVNRTHAFAVNRRFMQKFQQHVIHAPDYINAETDMHIDHQLGELHADIVTLAVDPWVCGQTENVSNISGAKNPEMWWKDKGWGK